MPGIVALSAGCALRSDEMSLCSGARDCPPRAYYRSADELIPLLDEDARPAMQVLVSIYHRLLDRVAANPAAVFRERVSVPTPQKLAILVVDAAQSLAARTWALHPRFWLSARDSQGSQQRWRFRAQARRHAAGTQAVCRRARLFVLASGAGRSYRLAACAAGLLHQPVDLCRLAGCGSTSAGMTTLRSWSLRPGSARPVQRYRAWLAAGAGALHVEFSECAMLSVGDKSSIARGMPEFLRGYPATDDEAFSTWLQRTEQTERAIRHFWEPLILATVNDGFERCSTRYAGKVFHEVFLASPAGGRLGIPTLPLSEFYDAPARLAVRQGTALKLRASVDRIEPLAGGEWRVHCSDGAVHQAPNLLLAGPFEQTAKLLATLPADAPQGNRIVPAMTHFTHAPITTVHLWFDRPVTELDHAALLDTRIQWMFNKSRIRRGEPSQDGEKGQYLELVISGSFAELQRTREEILPTAVDELAASSRR